MDWARRDCMLCCETSSLNQGTEKAPGTRHKAQGMTKKTQADWVQVTSECFVTYNLRVLSCWALGSALGCALKTTARQPLSFSAKPSTLPPSASNTKYIENPKNPISPWPSRAIEGHRSHPVFSLANLHWRDACILPSTPCYFKRCDSRPGCTDWLYPAQKCR